MIIQDFYLKNWDWEVRVYYFVDEFYADMIERDLRSLGCWNPEESVARLMSSVENSGMTFTSEKDRSAIIVIGRTSSAEEFQSTLDHEKGHLVSHIAAALDIELLGEEIQYLAGEVGRQMYKVARYFLCEHCYKGAKELIGCLVEND